ncbi:MAG: TonB-dependent receptor [Opitutales bacterium]
MSRLWTILFAGTTAAVAPFGALADEPELPQARMPDVHVTPLFFDLNPLEASADVTVLQREQLRGYGGAALTEVLRTEANIVFRSVSGRPSDGQVSLRGFGENSGLRVLVLVDGQRFNRPDLGGLDWQQIPLRQIERVEVIRGGQSILYGDQALAGVIKITTTAGEAPSGVELSGSGGSYGLLSGRAEGRVRDDRLFLSGSVNATREDGFRDNANFDTRGARVAGGYGPWQGVFSYQETERQFPGPLTAEQLAEDPRQSGNAGDERESERSTVASVFWEDITELGPAQLEAGVFHRDERWQLGGIDANNRQFTVTGSPRMRAERGPFALTGGVDTRYSQIDFTRFLNTTDLAPGERFVYPQDDAHLDRFTAAPYGLGEWEASEAWTFRAGARYEAAVTSAEFLPRVQEQIYPFRRTNRGLEPNPDFQETPDIDSARAYNETLWQSGWSAEAGIHWRWAPQGALWLRGNRVYRYPVLDELAAYQGFDLEPPFNADLGPESGWQVEAGGKWQSKGWELSVTAFSLWLEDEIVFVPDAGTDSGLNLNLPDPTRRFGVSPAIAYQGSSWGAQARGTWVDARFTDGPNEGNFVPLVPWFAGAASLWVEPAEGVRFSIDGTFESDRHQGSDFADTREELDSVALLGARLQVQANEHLFVYLRGDNLLDTTYASTAFAGNFYPGRGRFFELGATLYLQ